MTKHRPAPGLTKAQYAAALAREQAAHRAKPGNILAALAADCAGETLRPDDVTVMRVRAAMGVVSRPDSTIRRKIQQRVAAGELVVITNCFDPATDRYVTAYRAPEQERVNPPAMMHCPKCKAHVPRTPPVCANCGADTRKRK